MAVDILQEKIRKTKNPTMLEICFGKEDIPGAVLEEAGSLTEACAAYCRVLLTGLKDIVPAVRFSFTSFAVLWPAAYPVQRLWSMRPLLLPVQAKSCCRPVSIPAS